MSVENEIKSKRAAVTALKDEVRAERQKSADSAIETSRRTVLDSLSAEETSLRQELSSLRSTAPAPTVPPAPFVAASNKE